MFQIKCGPFICLRICCRLSCHILKRFLAARIFLSVAFSSDLLLQIAILHTLLFYFLCFSLVLLKKKIPRLKLFRPIFYDLILGRFNGNKILTLPSAIFNLFVCLPIGLLKFLFCYGKLFLILLENFKSLRSFY